MKSAKLGIVAGALLFGAFGAQAADDTIKVGVLHSLSGTMAISETTLKDTMLMLIEEQNKKGGLLGKKLEAVVVDPASNWPLFAEKTRELLQKDKVAAIFGCWTSVSRKSVLPVFEELNGLLFYPVQYEGEELSKNVFYTGAAPNQQAIPAVEYLMSKDGGSAKRWVLLGTDTAGSIGFDRVKIPVGQNDGGFKQLRVSVKDRDVTMTNLAVVYNDGAKDEIETKRTKIAADAAFGPVDLKKDATIKEIEATWRSSAIATSKRDRAYATVQVWGKH